MDQTWTKFTKNEIKDVQNKLKLIENLQIYSLASHRGRILYEVTFKDSSERFPHNSGISLIKDHM